MRDQQTVANNSNVASSLTWDAINKMMAPYGSPDIDYDRFSARYDSDPNVQQLVSKFDGKGIVVKTNKDEPEDEMIQNPVGSGGDSVEQMAKHATKRAFN